MAPPLPHAGGDEILWQGSPDTAPTLHPRPPSSVIFFDLLLVLFAGGAFVATIPFDPGALWLKALLLVLFALMLLVGLDRLGGYALRRGLVRRYTRYFLTRRQPIIYVDLPLLTARIETHDLVATMPLTLDRHGPGSVRFARRHHALLSDDALIRTEIGSTPYGFDRIHDADRVYRMMSEILRDGAG